MIDIDISYSFNSGVRTVRFQYTRDPNRRQHHVQSGLLWTVSHGTIYGRIKLLTSSLIYKHEDCSMLN